jgi:hypothetical protein
MKENKKKKGETVSFFFLKKVRSKHSSSGFMREKDIKSITLAFFFF